MFGVILGLSLNTFFGFRDRHFAVVIIAALIGGGYSTRQVLLHIAPEPGEPLGYGTPFLGMHLYTWGVVIFVACILGSAVFLSIIREEPQDTRRSLTGLDKAAFYVSFLLCAANLASTFLMCGIGPCCENGPCP